MVSLVQLVCITGLVLVSFVIYSQQQALAVPSSDEEYQLEKRRIDGHARTSIPLFRGSNLGIFVRKRPFATPEHSVIRRKETRANLDNEQSVLAELLNNNERHQRRFDDYSENPGPMFGR